MQKTITKFLILTIALTTALSASYLFAAWTGPTQAPPGGNTPTPIHVGSTDQVKDGGLSLSSLAVFGSGYFQGSVQIGNSGISPQAGTIRWTGSDLEVYTGDNWTSLTGSTYAPTCTSFTYSSWGACQSNGTQTRSVISSSPDGCVGGNPVIVQSCTYTLPMSTQCQNIGGSWIDAQNVCYFSGASCPSGWTKKENYSSTRAVTCMECDRKVTTSSHDRENKAVESVNYWSSTIKRVRTSSGGDRSYCAAVSPRLTCYAKKTEIGCTKN